MKTLSFHELKVGRSASQLLLELDTARQGDALGAGLNLIVAPNGYGKTTLLQTLAGVLNPLGGSVRWDGSPVEPERDVLYVSEYLTFPKFIYPAEWIEFVAGSREHASLDRWIEGFRLAPRMGSYLGRLSQGERRKITWLGAQASTKPIVLLDEPLDGLDLLAIKTARELVQQWRASGRVLGIVAHQVGEMLDLADQVYLIRDRRLQAWSSAMPRHWRELDAEAFRRAVLEFYSSAS